MKYETLEDIEMSFKIISEKMKNNEVLSYYEQKFYFEITKRELKQKIILLPQMKDYAFIIFYNIYLTDVNTEIYEMSLPHSNGIPIREIYGISLNNYQIKGCLKIQSDKFYEIVLKNEKLFKENNILKNLIKREFKEVEKKVILENNEIEIKTFNEILRAKRIYLHFENLNIINKKIILDNNEYDLNLDFYVHIAFRHYYHILQETDHYFDKDHFKTIKPEEWKEIIEKLSIEFNKKKLCLEDTDVINFMLNDTFFRLTLNKKKKIITSLFPLNEEEINKLNTVINI